jgi:hypothetical protein
MTVNVSVDRETSVNAGVLCVAAQRLQQEGVSVDH